MDREKKEEKIVLLITFSHICIYIYIYIKSRTILYVLLFKIVLLLAVLYMKGVVSLSMF